MADVAFNISLLSQSTNSNGKKDGNKGGGWFTTANTVSLLSDHISHSKDATSLLSRIHRLDVNLTRHVRNHPHSLTMSYVINKCRGRMLRLRACTVSPRMTVVPLILRSCVGSLTIWGKSGEEFVFPLF